MPIPEKQQPIPPTEGDSKVTIVARMRHLLQRSRTAFQGSLEKATRGLQDTTTTTREHIAGEVTGARAERERINGLVAEINGYEALFSQMESSELRSYTSVFRKKILNETESEQAAVTNAAQAYEASLGTAAAKIKKLAVEKAQQALQEKEESILETILPQAYALVREASVRTTGMRHFDEQLMGGIALHERTVAEMKTGEGKTLVATLPLYLNALLGRGAHLITTNEYLARVGAQQTGPIFEFLGMSVGVVQSHRQKNSHSLIFDRIQGATQGDLRHFRPTDRRSVYHCDITYTTLDEVGFDHHKDNTNAQVPEDQRLRKLAYAIVDEADSVLLDSASTPIAYSEVVRDPEALAESAHLHLQYANIAAQLEPDTHYQLDPLSHVPVLTEDGMDMVRELRFGESTPDTDIYTIPQYRHETPYLFTALIARTYQNGVDYVITDDKIILINQNTGRQLPGHTLQDGIHHALEAKEELPLSRQTSILASITAQNLLREYTKIAGMTGTAGSRVEKEEFSSVYGLDVRQIPTHKPNQRQDEAVQVYIDSAAQYAAIVSHIQQLRTPIENDGREVIRPILIGTTSIDESEKMSAALTSAGIAHRLLNAKNHDQEARIIAQAGRSGAVTISTNMAGRGVDISLGGHLEDIALEKIQSAAIDTKQIDTETWQSLLQQLKDASFVADHNTPEWANILAETYAEVRAEGDLVKAAGGLHVIGFVNKAKRIDDQLRGRAGRQGDPGSSVFYASLENRTFSSSFVNAFGRMKQRLERIRELLPEGKLDAVSQATVQKMISEAQLRATGAASDDRKLLLQYDAVANEQRKTTYADRQRILEQINGEGIVNSTAIRRIVRGILEQYAADLVQRMYSSPLVSVEDTTPIEQRLANINQVCAKLQEITPTIELLKPNDYLNMDTAAITTQLASALIDVYESGINVQNERVEAIVARNEVLKKITTLWSEHLDTLQDTMDFAIMQSLGVGNSVILFNKLAHAAYIELQKTMRESITLTLLMHRKNVQKKLPG